MTERRVAPQESGVVVMLPAVEHDLLRSLPEQLRQILDGSAAAPEARSRLFPEAYDDPELEVEYQEMTGAQLEEERLACVDVFAATLEEGRTHGGTWRCDLDEEATLAWLGAVQDARVTLATLLGIHEEGDWDDIDPEEPAAALLAYLSWLHEALLAAVAGRELG